jgi:cell cycle sensor histidine kinase DivJ
VLLSRTGRLDIAHCISAARLPAHRRALGHDRRRRLSLAALAGGRARRGDVLRLAALCGARQRHRGGCVGQSSSSCSSSALRRTGALDGDAMPLFVMLAILQSMALAVGFLRRRDDELREHRATDARAQLLLDHVGDLVTWHDANGGVVFANAAARALTGARSAELLGRGLLERVHIADRPLFLKALSDAAHGTGRDRLLPHALRAARRPGRAPGLALAGDAGAPHRQSGRLRDGVAAVVCVMRDITTRRRWKRSAPAAMPRR